MENAICADTDTNIDNDIAKQCRIVDPDLSYDQSKIVQSRNFALATYNKLLSTNEQRIVTTAFSKISPNDAPGTWYRIDAREIADILGINRAGHARCLNAACTNLVDNGPTLAFENEKNQLTRSVLIAAIRDIDQYTHEIQFGTVLHPYLTKMRAQEQDIFYDRTQKIHMRNQYTPLLYDTLLAYLCDTIPDQEGIFTIKIATKDLLKRLIYTESQIKICNQRAVKPACKEISKYTALDVLDNEPELIKEKKKIVFYIFRLKYKVGAEIPVRAGNLSSTKFYNSKTIPSMTDMTVYLKHIGLNNSFLKHVEKQNDVIKLYKTILYIKKAKNETPKYFNGAYTNDWGQQIDLSDYNDVKLVPTATADEIESLDILDIDEKENIPNTSPEEADIVEVEKTYNESFLKDYDKYRLQHGIDNKSVIKNIIDTVVSNVREKD